MRFKEFERAAHQAFKEIPSEYREGIDGLSVLPEALPHPFLPDVYTLGMCHTESYPSEWMGPDTTRSLVVLYHGSFERLAALDPGFDWGEELWETLTHELRHHLESLANLDHLEAVDYALDETFKRNEGEPFDPWYYQSGDDLGKGVYRVEHDFYIEQTWTDAELAAADQVAFDWHGATYRIPAPGELGDVHFIWIDGVEAGPGALQLVLLRKRPWWETFKPRKDEPVILESEAEAARGP